MEDIYLAGVRVLGRLGGKDKENLCDDSSYQVTMVIGCAIENLIFLAMLSRRTRFAMTAMAT